MSKFHTSHNGSLSYLPIGRLKRAVRLQVIANTLLLIHAVLDSWAELLIRGPSDSYVCMLMLGTLMYLIHCSQGRQILPSLFL